MPDSSYSRSEFSPPPVGRAASSAEQPIADTVAILDSGIAPDEALAGALVEGMNLSGDGGVDDTRDRFGHGTAVAHTIALLAPKAKLLPIKLLGDRGNLRRGDQIEYAFEWIAANREARRIGVVCAAFADASCLRGDEGFRDSPLCGLVSGLRAAGVATVAPAGNGYRSAPLDGGEGMAWPAILREVVSVGALERRTDGSLALAKSTRRLRPRPGGSCGTTVFTLPGPLGGTSGAAAVVSGALAILRVSHPSAPVDRLVRLLLDGVAADFVRGDAQWPE